MSIWLHQENRLAAVIGDMVLTGQGETERFHRTVAEYQRHIAAGVASGSIDDATARKRLNERADFMAAAGLARYAIAEARAHEGEGFDAKALAGFLLDGLLASPGRGLAVLLPVDRRGRIGPLARWLLDSMLPNDRIKTPPA